MAQPHEIPTPVSARARLGVAMRRHADEPELIEDARRNLAEANLASQIRRAVAEAPPLTDVQRVRLVALLVDTP